MILTARERNNTCWAIACRSQTRAYLQKIALGRDMSTIFAQHVQLHAAAPGFVSCVRLKLISLLDSIDRKLSSTQHLKLLKKVMWKLVETHLAPNLLEDKRRKSDLCFASITLKWFNGVKVVLS